MQWILTKPVIFPEYLESKTIDFISKLLQRDPKKRLGCGVTGAREAKLHPFVKNTNWTEMSVKKIKSPFKISVKGDDDTSYFSSTFTGMSIEEELKAAAGGGTDSSGQFDNWSHTAPTINL